MAPRRLTPWRLAVVSCCTAANGIAAGGFTVEVFDRSAAWRVITVAAVASGGVGLVVGRRGLRAELVAVLHLVALAATLGTLGNVGWLGPERPGPLEPLVLALSEGWRTTLNTTLPTVANAATLAWLAALLWVATAITVATALHTRAVLGVVTAPAVLAVIAALSSEHVTATGWWPAALVPVLVLLAATCAAAEAGRFAMPVQVAGLAVVALSGATVVGAMVPEGDPIGFPRFGSVEQRTSPPIEADPLQFIAAVERLGGETAELGRISKETGLDLIMDAPAGSSVEQIRLGVLTRFDGARWLPPEQLRPLGSQLPGSGSGDGTREVDLALGAWDWNVVPLPVGSLSVGGDGRRELRTELVADPDGGMVATGDGSWLADARLRIRVADEPVAAALPAWARQLAGTLRDGEVRAGRFDTTTEAAEQFLGFDCTDPVPVLVPPTGPRIMFVHAFAVWATCADHPVRVAVGFETGGGTRVERRSADLTAWPEVLVGRSWVPVDAAPADVSRADPTLGVAPSATPTTLPPASDPTASTTTTTTSLAASTTSAPPRDSGQPRTIAGTIDEDGGRPVWIPVGAGLLGFALVVLLTWRPLRRRSRRRRGSPADRVLGAWRELLAVVGARGRDPRATTGDVVGLVERHASPAATDAARTLAATYDRSVFAAHEATEDDARAAWVELDRFRVAWAADSSRRRTVRPPRRSDVEEDESRLGV